MTLCTLKAASVVGLAWALRQLRCPHGTARPACVSTAVGHCCYSAVSVETIDDRAEFAALVQAMRTVGLSAEEQVLQPGLCRAAAASLALQRRAVASRAGAHSLLRLVPTLPSCVHTAHGAGPRAHGFICGAQLRKYLLRDRPCRRDRSALHPRRCAATHAAALRLRAAALPLLQVSSCEALETVCALLGVEAHALTTALTTRKVRRSALAVLTALLGVVARAGDAERVRPLPSQLRSEYRRAHSLALSERHRRRPRCALPRHRWLRVCDRHMHAGGRRWRTHARVL